MGFSSLYTISWLLLSFPLFFFNLFFFKFGPFFGSRNMVFGGKVMQL